VTGALAQSAPPVAPSLPGASPAGPTILPAAPAQSAPSDTILRNTAIPERDPTVRRSDEERVAAAIAVNRSYLIPALEIVGFDALLNRIDYAIFDGAEYKVSPRTWRDNLRHGWVVDNDPYSVNQFLHPYQGSMYHGFARSAGLDYWHALGYTFAGSAMWEYFGETTPPSKNDQVASGIAGSFLGEALFRMANLMLERHDAWPQWWKEVGAAALSPPVGFNRLAFRGRFGYIFPSHDPEYYSRLSLGVSTTTSNIQGASTDLKDTEGVADFSMDYGLPGKPDYTYKRPFDYFTLQATASTANGFENIMTKGLLVGRDYGFGSRYRGIWGLYGSYDYIAPQIFRISSTALSLGTTGQVWASDNIAIQGTGMFGVGYAAAGTLHGAQDPDNRDYHYGVAPQALLGLRVIFGDRYSLDLTGREYFVSRLGGVANTGGSDNIVRLDAALSYRISGKHAVSLRYLLSRRDASFSNAGDITQQRGTIGIYYTLLGHDRFGAVDWRR
jgi:hypothetical protein